jgi:protein TonB
MKTNSQAYGKAVYAETIEDIIFEGRNHNYGAYFLRTHYSNHLFTSLLTVLFFASIIIGIPLIRAHFFPKPVINNNYNPNEGGVTITVLQDKAEDPVTPPPPADEEVFKKIAQTISFTDPVVVDRLTDPSANVDLRNFLIEDIDNLNPGEVEYRPGNYDPTDGGAIENPTNTKTYESYEVTEPAVFPGGPFNKWVEKNIVYNPDAISTEISGKVFIRFTIDEEGNVTNIIVERSLHSLLDQAAVEAIKKSPKWKPAKYNGNKVKVVFRMPLRFIIEK